VADFLELAADFLAPEVRGDWPESVRSHVPVADFLELAADFLAPEVRGDWPESVRSHVPVADFLAHFLARSAALDSAEERACSRSARSLSPVVDSRESEVRGDWPIHSAARLVDFLLPGTRLPALVAARYSAEPLFCLLELHSV
jgi:hypothetical protein